MFKNFKVLEYLVLFMVAVTFIYVLNAKPVFCDIAEEYEIYTSKGSVSTPISLSKNSFLPLFTYGEGCKANIVDLEGFLQDNGITVLFSEEIDGGISYYGFSKKYKYKKEIKGKTVSIQIYKKGDYVKVGSPIIYGSY